MTHGNLSSHVFGLVLLASSPFALADEPQAAGIPATVIEEAADPEFNLELPLRFGPEAADAKATVSFDEQEGGDRLELRITREELSLFRRQAGQQHLLAGPAPVELPEDGAVLITLRRRLDKVSVLIGGRCFLAIWEEALAGKLGLAAPPGLVDEENLYYQPYAPPHFDDDFMRGQQESFGDWQVISGTWENTALVENLEFVPRAANSFAFAAHPESIALAAAGADFWDDYQCAVSVRVLDQGEAGLAFRAQDEANYYALALAFGHPESPHEALLELRRVTGASPVVLARERLAIPPGQWYRLSVVASGESIEAAIDGVPTFAVTDGALCAGPVGLLAANCETVYFDDAEVREVRGLRETFDVHGLARWRVIEGDWRIASAREPGASFLTSASAASAFAVAGRASWRDYECQADFRPARGALGICFYWTDPDSYWLWRWGPREGGRQELVRVKDGAEEVVDESALDLAPGDWHRAVIRAGTDHACVSVDGSPAVEALIPEGSSGKVGLWAGRGSRAAFDSVTVRFPPGYVPARLPETMEADAEMKEQFANPAETWFSVEDEAHRPQGVGMNWNKGEYFGSVDVTLPITNVTAAEGKVTVTIEGDQTAPGGGYDLALTTKANSPKLSLELFRTGDLLERAEIEVSADADACAVRLGRRGTYVVVYANDQLVIAFREKAPGEPPLAGPDDSIPQVDDAIHTATEATRD